jgi:protein-L-isoaspartate(D-aspartate) O-methyltransferase
VIEAFHRVDRKFFVPQSYNQYQDAPQPLEPSDDTEGATISAPHMHAYAVESLAPHCKPNGRVLDIGSGSGYLLPIFRESVPILSTLGSPVLRYSRR